MKVRGKKLLVVLLAFLPAVIHAAPGLEGSWQGFLDVGLVKFRVALVIEKNTQGQYRASFNNIDDGIYDEPLLRVSVKAGKIQGELATGEALDLNLNFSGDRLEGNYRQAAGSFQTPGKNSRLILKRGIDYLSTHLDAEGKPVTRFVYQVPETGTDGWDTGDLRDIGVDLKTIETGMRKILNGTFPHIHSLTLVHHGKLVLDEYFYGYGPEEPHPVQSITKSVFSLLFGMAVDQGRLKPGDKLYDFFPQYRTKKDWDIGKNNITLEMLLTMTSGLGCDDWKDSKNCSWAMVTSSNWLDFGLSLPLTRKPGKKFSYCGACLTPLSVVLASKSGLSVPAFAAKFLWEPLRIRKASWVKGSGGITPVSFGLEIRPRDLAKIGYLILKNGKWENRQVVSEKWIQEATSPVISSARIKGEADYGYLWWQTQHRVGKKNIRSVCAWGVGGQYLWVVPELDLVCVATGGNYKNGKLGANALKLFQENILKAFSKRRGK